MVLRSDEEANQEEIKRDKNFRGNVGKAVGTAAAIGTAAISPALSARVMPFLNQYIPAGLAMKGINKVSPRLGQFLKKGQEMGLDVQEGLNFIKEKFGSNSQPAKQNKNIIEQYSPELHQFISQEVSGGRKPMEAAAIAQNDKRFSEIIKKLSKDHNTSWSSIIDSIYGTGQYGGAVNPTNQGQQPQGGQQMQQPSQPGQTGPGQQALTDILNKINQKLGQ